MEKLQYQVGIEDLEKCVEFGVGYHLNVGGGSYNRTTGQYRGLGGKFDNFVTGKLIEIGVASIIEKFTDKKILLDFEIHGPTDDPDIIGIEEGKETRKPELFIEIKNFSLSKRWVGLTKGQFNTILENEIVEGDPTREFAIYAHLTSGNKGRDDDRLGAYLREKTNSSMFNNFCNPSDFRVNMEYVVRMDELKNKGTDFDTDSYMYETDVFRPASDYTIKRVLDSSNRDTFKPIEISGNTLPIIMRDNRPKPEEFGEFEYEGDLKVFRKDNEKSKRMYVYCESDVTVKNEVLGEFRLDAGKVYETYFETIGRSPTLKRNNIWIAQRNIQNVLEKDAESRVKEIAEKI